MNEEAWLASTDAVVMVDSLGSDTTDRKLWLFAAACCRWLDDRCRELGERYLGEEKLRIIVSIEDGADTLFGEVAMGLAAFPGPHTKPVTPDLVHDIVTMSARNAARQTAFRTPRELWGLVKLTSADEATAGIAREVLGNPFIPTDLDPRCLTARVVELAQGIYSERHFTRMPELADALAAVGCSERSILEHLRGAGPHFRGCWALDRVLGKN